MGIDGGPHGQSLEAVGAEPFCCLLLRKQMPQLRVCEARRGPEAVSTRHIEIAGQTHQEVDGAVRLDGVGADVIGAGAPRNRGGLDSCIGAGRGANGICVAPGNIRDRLRCILLRALAQGLKSMAPLRHEFVVVEVFLDDDVDPRERHCGIGAGPE
jgi:hypothetical protein